MVVRKTKVVALQYLDKGRVIVVRVSRGFQSPLEAQPSVEDTVYFYERNVYIFHVKFKTLYH